MQGPGNPPPPGPPPGGPPPGGPPPGPPPSYTPPPGGPPPGGPPPAGPPPYGPQAAYEPQRRGTPWGKILGFTCLGCGCLGVILGALIFFMVGSLLNRTPLPASQQAYVGTWTGGDGTFLTIRADGSGDLRAGSTTVTNGQVKIDEAARTLSITLWGAGRTYKIDTPPTDATSPMALDGVTFSRAGSSASGTDDGATPDTSTGNTPTDSGGTPYGTTPSGNTPSDTGTTPDGATTSGDTPSEDEVKRLVTESLMQFNQAVQAKDFNSFYSYIAPFWQKQTTAEKLQETFQGFIDKNINVGWIENVTPTFDSAPSIAGDVLTASGTFDGSASAVTFKLDYKKEEGAWRLIGINVSVR